MEDNPLGKVVHYFDKAMVAVIRLDSGGLKIGDEIRFAREEYQFSQTVESMQIDYKVINSAEQGQEVGVKVSQPAKEGTLVYRV